jgi:N-methylhydantoinase A
MSAGRAADVAVRTLESGPAAGVIAARRAGLDAGVRDLLAFDMGGTTAKAGVVRDGRVSITRDFQAGGKGSFGGRRAGTGVPVKVPAVDLAEVGSGGGSIAWVDGGGVLHVGPRSAGAHPGPACYGFGGAAATVTDADLVLGYLDPDTFAGGTLRLHPELAGKAIDELAGRLRCDRLQAAHAIAHIADAGMGFAVHVVTVQRGIDPRRFTLVASGGAGPMHAARIAERFGITSLLVPDASGVSSAVGLLDCDLTTERSRTLPVALALADVTAVRELAGPFATLEAEARRDLEADAAAAGAAIRMTREVDLRYRGQAFALTVPVPHDALDAEAVAALATAFHTEYALSYGSHADVPLELVTIRVRALLAVDRATPGAAAVAGEPVIGSRPMSFTSADGYRPTPVLRRERMPIGYAVTGPAVIEDAGSTTVVPPGWHADLLPGRTLRLSRDATSA